MLAFGVSFASIVCRLATLFALIAALSMSAPSWADTVCKANPGGSSIGAPTGIINTYFQGVTGTLAGGLTTTSLTLGTRDTRGMSDPIVVAICC